MDIRVVGGVDDTPTPNQDSTPTAPSKGQMDVAMPTQATSKVLATPAVRRIAGENKVSAKVEFIRTVNSCLSAKPVNPPQFPKPI